MGRRHTPRRIHTELRWLPALEWTFCCRHTLVVELKFVRDRVHAKKIGNELIVDIEHYRKHPECQTLWCVVYDPNHYLTNAEGLCSDLSGRSSSQDVELETKVFVL